MRYPAKTDQRRLPRGAMHRLCPSESRPKVCARLHHCSRRWPRALRRPRLVVEFWRLSVPCFEALRGRGLSFFPQCHSSRTRGNGPAGTFKFEAKKEKKRQKFRPHGFIDDARPTGIRDRSVLPDRQQSFRKRAYLELFAAALLRIGCLNSGRSN
jgi:hypothetical protein